MNKAILAAAGLAVIGGVYYFTAGKGAGTSGGITLPSLSKSELSTLVKSQTASYQDHGFEIVEKDGVFVLKAKDEQKVRTFLFDNFAEMLPDSYTSTLKPLKREFLKEHGNITSGLEFDMQVIDTSEGAKLEVVLRKLPTEMQKELEISKDAQWLKELLDKGAFAYTLSMDKTGKINGIALKDIVEHIEIDKTVIDAKSKGIWAKFIGDVNGKFQLEEAAEIISLNVKDVNNFIGFTINNIEGKVDQTTLYDKVASSSIERITFDFEKHDRLSKFLMTGIALNSKSEDDKGFINSGIDIASHKVDFKVMREGHVDRFLTLDDFRFAITGKHISKEAADVLQSIGLTSNSPKEMKKLQLALEKMVKTGLSIDVDAFDVKKMVFASPFLNLEVKDFAFKLHAQLKENSLDMNMGSPMQYIPFIKINARLAVNKTDLTTLIAMQPMAGVLASMKKIEGELAVFELLFENGQMTVNGKPLPF